MHFAIFLLPLLPELVHGVNYMVNCTKYPGPCNHRCYSIYTAGQPSVLTWDKPSRAVKRQRRKEVGAIPNPCCNSQIAAPASCWDPEGNAVACTSPDEYPYASSVQGGPGGIIRCTGELENEIEGSEWGGVTSRGTANEGCNKIAPCQITVSFMSVDERSPYCATTQPGVNDGFEWTKRDDAWIHARDGDRLVLQPHQPDPADFFPPHLRRELLLDNGERVLLGSRDLEKDWQDEVFVTGNITARVIRELHGEEKSAPFRPLNTTSTTN